MALSNPEVFEVLGSEGSRSSSYDKAHDLTDTAWNGPLVCSMYACLGTSSDIRLAVCDATYSNIGCLQTQAGVELADVRVGDSAKKAEICKERTCFVPGKLVSDNRPQTVAQQDPVSFFVSGYELLVFGNDIVA
jgi:hypothetical protein